MTKKQKKKSKEDKQISAGLSWAHLRLQAKCQRTSYIQQIHLCHIINILLTELIGLCGRILRILDTLNWLQFKSFIFSFLAIWV